ncbi:hypothetical protein VIGAN_04081400 [Vigna angularis var. angularis]|uniref:S-protein homolog n=1 Tax=Vigna angularis var. angularis TaxID=157739 RepID=A0A0S3RSR0_PHAAN|nr:hypothetical protein VIGAN_04081400 [Vigna angularis var. angularis]
MLTLAWAIEVKVTNTLEGRENLNIHCKSKDDDLGRHLLHFNQTFQWTFGHQIFGKTLFFCSIQWGNGQLLHFDAYVQTRDLSVCSLCEWYIKKNGPCRYEDFNAFRCYKWN